MISKKRYWGLALPIWECADCGHFDVVGSDHELQERAVEGYEVFEGHTPHRPYIDAIKIRCTQCGALSARIKDVGNPWLDAGIVPYSTLNYLTNREKWDEWFPADLISESFPGQFRNWFYSLLAQSAALVRRPPFKNVLGFATLLAEDGREMHKSWGNAIEFNEAANVMGADVMRWLYLHHRPEQNMLFGYKLGDETRRRFLIPLWNVYSFFVTYANLDDWQPGQAASPTSSSTANAQMDAWISARLHETVVAVTASLAAFDSLQATLVIEAFLDDLSNWYVRRGRRRFWKSERDADKLAALETLYEVLVTLTKLLAPFVPFTTEAMYQNLVRSVDTDAPVSVHHTDWPVADPERVNRHLLDKMGLAIAIAALGRAARSSADVKPRCDRTARRAGGGDQRQTD
jgi:isoleucyl-tRNA synthetase